MNGEARVMTAGRSPPCGATIAPMLCFTVPLEAEACGNFHRLCFVYPGAGVTPLPAWASIAVAGKARPGPGG